LSFEFGNPGSDPVNWEVSLPSFAGVELTMLEIDKAQGLLDPGPGPRRTYAALGDSITHGTGQGSASHLSWPFLLSRKLGFELYNLAVGGSGVSIAAAQALAGLDRIDVVTILFGYNDWNGEGDSVEAFASQYRQMLSEVRAVQPGAEVFCISPLVTRREQSKSTGLPIDAFRGAVQELALEWGSFDPKVHFIDGEAISSFENLQPAGSKDVVHLTVEGAAMLADSLFPVIEAELR
jgi:lysophospholipase L1-like esterase